LIAAIARANAQNHAMTKFVRLGKSGDGTSVLAAILRDARLRRALRMRTEWAAVVLTSTDAV
jgi:hypothetical protein